MCSSDLGDELVAARDSTGVSLLLLDSRCGRELAAYPATGPMIVVGDATLEGAERERDRAAVDRAIGAGAITLDALLNDTRAATVGAAPQVAPLDAATILFTSGTTGRAKGAVLSHFGTCNSVWTNLYAGYRIAADMAARYGISLQQLAAMAPQTCMLLMFPFFHTSGLHTGLQIGRAHV